MAAREINKTKILKTIQKEILEILNYMKKQERVKDSFFEDKIGPYSRKKKNYLMRKLLYLLIFQS